MKREKRELPWFKRNYPRHDWFYWFKNHDAGDRFGYGESREKDAEEAAIEIKAIVAGTLKMQKE